MYNSLIVTDIWKKIVLLRQLDKIMNRVNSAYVSSYSGWSVWRIRGYSSTQYLLLQVFSKPWSSATWIFSTTISWYSLIFESYVTLRIIISLCVYSNITSTLADMTSIDFHIQLAWNLFSLPSCRLIFINWSSWAIFLNVLMIHERFSSTGILLDELTDLTAVSHIWGISVWSATCRSACRSANSEFQREMLSSDAFAFFSRRFSTERWLFSIPVLNRWGNVTWNLASE